MALLDILAIFLGLALFVLPVVGIVVVLMLLGGIKIVMQYQKGVKFTLGKYAGIMNPGLNFVIPIFQSWQRVDTRIVAQDIQKQAVITKDNIPVNIDAVIYYKVADPKKAVLEVAQYRYAVSKYGQTSLRDVAGEATLDELLSDRERIAGKLEEVVDNVVKRWGLDVTKLELQHIELPDNLKRVMASQAEAEREKRGVIIKAQGEVIAAKNFAAAAKKLATSEHGLFLRTLEEMTSLSPDKSQTNIHCVPVELLDTIKAMGVKK